MSIDELRVDRRTAMVGGVGVVAATAAVATIGARAASAAPRPQTQQCAAGPIAKTADVPVGSGVIVGDTVITQPTAGQFRGFCATCTHMGCHLTEVREGTINCPCHGSKFHLDGTVAHGPAFIPLLCRPVHVEGEDVVLDQVIPGMDIPCPTI